MKITGYAAPWTVAPGDAVHFKISTAAKKYSAVIQRLIHGDENPRGPGFKAECVSTDIDGDYVGHEQAIRTGSYVEIPDGPRLALGSGFTVSAWIWPTTPDKGVQALISKWDGAKDNGFGLFIDNSGAISLWLGEHRLSTKKPLRANQWYFVAASFDPESGRASSMQVPQSYWPREDTRASVTKDLNWTVSQTTASLMIAAHNAGNDGKRLLTDGHYNGKIEAPRLFSRALTCDELQTVSEGGWRAVASSVVAAWNFGRDFDTERVTDESRNELHGRARQMPAKAMTGHNWSGAETDYKRAPNEYAAIHFHADDLEDAHWQTDFEWTVPAGLQSGIYAAHVTTDEADDHVFFFVRPPEGKSSSAVAFLAPTASYLAYANDRMTGGPPQLFSNQDPTINPDVYAYCRANGLLSTYDLHEDGSGVCYSSRLRPTVNMRPGFHHADLGCPHQLSADLHLIDWLEEKEFAHDVLTDEILHLEGIDLLRPYRVIVTGTHPEYWSLEMLDALKLYLDEGGRLMYMGGNGFYWVTSFANNRPHVVEIRRAEGIRAWEHKPGELYHSTSGQRGGLWRWRGREPQKLAGIGFSAQGFDNSSPYRRNEDSYDPRAAFIFDGVEGEIIGDHDSLIMNRGAAGFELDRADDELGTPAHTLRLASSFGHSDSYQHVIEEVLMSNSMQGGTIEPRVRADMVYFEYPNNGAVFSTGSIAWCGALSHNSYDNNVSRITENVLRAFQSNGPIRMGS